MNLFEQASRDKFRFQSPKGPLTVEDLWDLPLTNRSGVDLDNVAKLVNKSLKDTQEESFVSTRANTAQEVLAAKLEVVKFIIAFRLKEREDAAQREKRSEERKRLLEALENKKDESLRGMSAEQILARIAELDKA